MWEQRQQEVISNVFQQQIKKENIRMEGTLLVTPEQLQSAAGEFSTKAGTISSLTSQMTDTVTGLSGAWEGEAATAYVNKFRQLDDDIQKMIRMVQEHSNDLNDMAQVYLEAENANREEAEALAGDVIV